VLGQIIARYRAAADHPGRLTQQLLAGEVALLRPACDARELTGEACAEYERDVLDRAMDLLTGRMVDALQTTE
jgi:hypothetical protein